MSATLTLTEDIVGRIYNSLANHTHLPLTQVMPLLQAIDQARAAKAQATQVKPPAATPVAPVAADAKVAKTTAKK